MKVNKRQQAVRAGAIVSGVLACLAFTGAWAADSATQSAVLDNSSLTLISSIESDAPPDTTPFSLAIESDAGLDFDLGGSDQRKLQLVLDQPLTLSTGSRTRMLDNGSNLLGLDATLNVPLSDQFSLSANIDRQVGKARFQSLGSIQCMNGTLHADSYTASGCRFVDEPLATSDRLRLDLGAQMNFGAASASIGWFSQDSTLDRSGSMQYGSNPAALSMGGSLLSPNLGNPLLGTPSGDPMQYLNSEASGVDLNFKVGFTTDTTGDIRLGLAFTRVLEGGFESLYARDADLMSWTLAEPFNSARMNLEWSKGNFSSGIQGFYRDSVDFLNRSSVDSLTTFDVHFTWRTPWNANLSVGASNLLNANGENSSPAENQPVDPLESIYGRIPYVRYKQDL